MKDEHLIAYVSQYPALYQRTCSGYKDTGLKKSIWVEIGAKMKCKSEECSKRWTVLRERYTREHSSVRKGAPSGSAASTKRPWELWDAMSFLEPHTTHRVTSHNFQQHPEEAQESSAVNLESASSSPQNFIPETQAENEDLQEELVETPCSQAQKWSPAVAGSSRSAKQAKVLQGIDDRLHSLSQSLTSSKEEDANYAVATGVYAALQSIQNPVLELRFRKEFRNLINQVEEEVLAASMEPVNYL